jgi:xanthine phosphoribosyltransferase
MTKRQCVSWEVVQAASRSLARDLAALQEKAPRPYRGIIAVTRGGMVPATIVAHQLGLRDIHIACVSTYEDGSTAPGAARIRNLSGMWAYSKGQDWIIIDDIIDSGATMRLLHDIMPLATFGVMFSKRRHSDPTKHYTGDQLAIGCDISELVDTWVELPWE